MGIRYVGLALSPQWAGLSLFARLVLTTMAARVVDYPCEAGPEGLYWAGHRQLAMLLCGVRDTSDTNPAWVAARRRIARAIRELRAAGAIEVVQPAAASARAVYDLTAMLRRPLPGLDEVPDGAGEPASDTPAGPVDIPSAGPVDMWITGGREGPRKGGQGDTSVSLRVTPVSPSG